MTKRDKDRAGASKAVPAVEATQLGKTFKDIRAVDSLDLLVPRNLPVQNTLAHRN